MPLNVVLKHVAYLSKCGNLKSDVVMESSVMADNFNAHFYLYLRSRLAPIMLLKFPIMLMSNGFKHFLLCSNRLSLL